MKLFFSEQPVITMPNVLEMLSGSFAFGRIYKYTYMCIYMYTYIFVYIYIYAYTSWHIDVHTPILMHVYIN